VRRIKGSAHVRRGFSWRVGTAITLAVTLVAATAASALWLQARANSPDRIPSYVAWTPETLAAASRGDAFRGMLLARRCDHCHGPEGFSAVGYTPNLAGIDRLAIWKQLEDF
jgi:flagellin-like protein